MALVMYCVEVMAGVSARVLLVVVWYPASRWLRCIRCRDLDEGVRYRLAHEIFYS